MEYLILLFKNKKRKKIINKFKTLENATLFYNKLVKQSNDVIFDKKVENANPCIYEIGLVSSKKINNEKLFLKDSMGRQLRIELDDDDYQISKLSGYKIEEKFFDLSSNKKITTQEFLKIYLSSSSIKMLSKLNNKVVFQNNDHISLFSFKNEIESKRFLDNLSDYFMSIDRVDTIIVSEDSPGQKKYLYDILEKFGFDKKLLYRTFTTFKPR